MLNIVNKYNFSKVHTPLCIVGCGTASLNLSSQLIKKGVDPSLIRVFDSQKSHYYQPAWTMVGGGIYNVSKTVRQNKDLFHPKINMIVQNVQKIFPQENRLITNDGREWTYDQIIIATGINTDFEAVKGMKEALEDPDCPVGSIYWKDYAVKFSNLVDKFKGGNVIFTEPPHPIKCAGAPQKIMYLTEERFRKKKGLRESTKIEFNKAVPFVFAVPKYSSILTELIKQKNIGLNLKMNLKEIKPKERLALFEDLDTKQIIEKPFDLLHVVPPQRPPSFIKESGLGDPAGFCNVDKIFLFNRQYKNVWALGDSSNLPTSKTAAAIMGQTPVLVRNLLHVWRDNMPEVSMPGQYEGYTSCPIFSGDHKLILAEFKYDAVIDETFYSKQDQPHYSFYFLKKYLFPFAYWNLVPRGIWYGREGIKPHILYNIRKFI